MAWPDIPDHAIRQTLRLQGYEIHQVVDLENITGGKDSLHAGLVMFIHHGSPRRPVCRCFQKKVNIPAWASDNGSYVLDDLDSCFFLR